MRKIARNTYRTDRNPYKKKQDAQRKTARRNKQNKRNVAWN